MILASRESLGDIDVPSLARIAESLHAIRGTPGEFLLSDRLTWLGLLEFLYVREGGDWLDVSECTRINANWGASAAAPVSRLWNLASPVFHDLETARRAVNGHFDTCSRCGNLLET